MIIDLNKKLIGKPNKEIITHHLGSIARLLSGSKTSYREKYPDAPLVMGHISSKRSAGIKAKGGYKPISEKRGAKQCSICDDWYQPETAKAHSRK